MIVTCEAEIDAARAEGRAAVLSVPRCPYCGLTVMSCPDTRWAEYHGVYPLWMPKSMAVALGDGAVHRMSSTVQDAVEAQAHRLCDLGLLS